jgi:hypothetical protein
LSPDALEVFAFPKDECVADFEKGPASGAGVDDFIDPVLFLAIEVAAT